MIDGNGSSTTINIPEHYEAETSERTGSLLMQRNSIGQKVTHRVTPTQLPYLHHKGGVKWSYRTLIHSGHRKVHDI